MSKFTLEITTDNDAFGCKGDEFRAADCRAEIARILRETACLVEAEITEGSIDDYYGNRVGSYQMAEG